MLKPDILSRIDRLSKTMLEAAEVATKGNGVHPHVVGAWIRELRRIKDGLEQLWSNPS